MSALPTGLGLPAGFNNFGELSQFFQSGGTFDTLPKTDTTTLSTNQTGQIPGLPEGFNFEDNVAPTGFGGVVPTGQIPGLPPGFNFEDNVAPTGFGGVVPTESNITIPPDTLENLGLPSGIHPFIDAPPGTTLTPAQIDEILGNIPGLVATAGANNPDFGAALANPGSALNWPELQAYLEDSSEENLALLIGSTLTSEEDNDAAQQELLDSISGTQTSGDTLFAELISQIEAANPLNPFSDELVQSQKTQANNLITQLVQSTQKQNLANFANRGLGQGSQSFAGAQGVNDLGISSRTSSLNSILENQFNSNIQANAARSGLLTQVGGLQSGFNTGIGGLEAAALSGQVLDPATLTNLLGDAISGVQSLQNQNQATTFANATNQQNADQAFQSFLSQIISSFVFRDSPLLQAFGSGVGTFPSSQPVQL